MAKFVLTAQLELQAPKNSAKIVSDIQQQLKGVTIPLEMKGAADASKQIDKLAESTRQAGSAAEAMGRSFGLAVKRFAAFTVASRAVSLFTNSLASAVDEAIAFQREVVRVSQVTGKPVKDLRDLTDTITRLSVTLGTSSKDLLSTATILAQAGIEAGDLTVALDALAKTTLAPNFDSISETAEGAVAILAQFGQGVGALEQQLSSINAVAGAFAVESEDLIGAVRRFGGVFKASGGSLEELLAVFTSVRATTRESAESISTGLRTIFTRLQRPKTIEFLKQFGVELTTLDGKFVGPFEAAKRLSEVFGQLEQGDITFIRVAEELGGFRQIGKVIPLLQQFALAQEALNVAQSGSDSLAKDAATAQQALAVQITKVKEEFLALVRGVAESDSFQLFARTSLEVASALIKVADAIKPLLPLIGALAAFQFAKGLGTFASSAGAAVRGLGTLGGAQAKSRGGEVLAFASGGVVPGVGNSDTVPAMLTPGEFVIRKSSVNKIGADTLHAMNENRYAKGGLVVQKFEDGGEAQQLTSPTALTPANIKKLGGKAATLEKIKERFNHRITFTANKGEIGGFILTPEQGSDKDYSPNANVLVPLTPQDPAYVKLIHQYDIPEKLTPEEKAIINQTQYDPKTPYARTLDYLAQPQNQRPNISAIISKDSTFPEFYPGGRGATETQNKLSEVLKDQAAKALGDAGTASANSAKLLFKGLSPIELNINKVSNTIQEKIKGDKQAIDTLSGYIFESMIAGVTGAEPAGGKAAFDFDLANNLPEVKNNLGIFFGSQERIKGLKKAEAKKSRGQFAAQDGVLRKLSNSIRGGDFTGLTISDATKQNNPINPSSISKSSSKSTSVEPIKTNTAMSDPKALNEGSSGSGAKKALRKVGYIDSDVLNDPRYEGIVQEQMQKLGIKGHSAYKQYLAELAVKSRKSGPLGKLTNIVGMAGAGKSSLMLGKQAADQSTLRETQRFPILTPEDIDKASSVINVTASLNEKDVEDFINPADRTVVLSSSTKEEQDVIRKRRKKRDTEITAGTSATGFGRRAGSTKGAPTDSAYIEALIQAGATDPKKIATLGVTEKGFRRKGASELPAVKEELINLFYGNFGPATKGHELARQEGLKQTPGAKSLVAVGIDTPVVEGDEHSYRSALMSQKERTAMAKQVFSGAYVAQANKANYGFSLPSLYEVGVNEQGQRTFIKPAKGSTATVGEEKGDKALAKYEKAGLSVVSLPRMEDISGTQLREAAIAKDTNKVKELTTPEGFNFLQGQTSTALGNRAAILPEIISRTFAKSNKKVADIESQIKEILPTGRVGKTTPEDVKERVAELRKQRDKIKESAGYKPLKTMEKLKKFNPKKYAFAQGGAAPSDTVPALLTPGEFVVNRQAAERIGYSNLNRMNKHGVTGFAKGGPVGFRFGGKAAKANIEDSFNREGTALVKTISDVENVFKDFLSNLTTLPSAVKDTVNKIQTFELTKNQTFTNTNVGRKQVTGDELRGISLGGKVGINLQKGTEHTVKHEVSHEIDRSLGQTTGKAGKAASLQEGTFQNKIAKELQITYKKIGDVTKYRLSLEELFADALAKAPPEVQKIIVSTTDAAEGSKKLAEYFQKAGKPVAGLADLSADEFGGMQASVKSSKTAQKTTATTAQKVQQAKQSTNSPVSTQTTAKPQAGGGGVLGRGIGVDIFAFTAALGSAQAIIKTFGDVSNKASDTVAAFSIGLEKGIGGIVQLVVIFSVVKQLLAFSKALKEAEAATKAKTNEEIKTTTENVKTITESGVKLDTRDTAKKLDQAKEEESRLLKKRSAADTRLSEKQLEQKRAGQAVQRFKGEITTLEGMQATGVSFKSQLQQKKSAAIETSKAQTDPIHAKIAEKEKELQAAEQSKGFGGASALFDTDKIRQEMASLRAELDKVSSETDKVVNDIDKQLTTLAKLEQENSQHLEAARQNLIQSEQRLEKATQETAKAAQNAANANDNIVPITQRRIELESQLQREQDDSIAHIKRQQEATAAATQKMGLAERTYIKIRDESKKITERTIGSIKSYIQQKVQENAIINASTKFIKQSSAIVASWGVGIKSGFSSVVAFLKKEASILNTALSSAAGGIKKLASSAKNLAIKGAGVAKAGFNRVSGGLAVGGGIVAGLAAIGSQIASGFEEYFKRQEEILKSQDNLTGAVEAASKASISQSIGEAFTIPGYLQAVSNPQKFVQNAVEKQQTTEFNVAKEFIPTRTQAALEKIKAGGTKEKPLDEGAIVSKSIEAFSRARSEAQDLKGPAREKAMAEINAESRKFISDLAESGMSLEGLKNTAYSLSGGNEDLRKKLLEQVKAIEASRKAQEALNKANLDSLKITSAFGAAADASARLVAGLETGANSLALYSDELENAAGRLGVDTSAIIDAAEKELLSIAGTRGGGTLAASISGQAQTARVVSGFSVGAGANLGNLKLSSDQAEAKRQLTDAFNASIPDNADPDTRRKLEALIDKNIASIQGDVSQVDLSKLAKDIQGDAAELSKGFNEAVKLQGQHNATMATLYQKREQLEQKAADAANQAIETQLEAAKIFEEFGGSRLTEQQQLGARISQFNNVGALGGLGAQLTTGSAADIRGVAAEIGRTFAEQTDQVIGTTLARGAGKETGLGAFAGAAGFGADKRPEIEAANKALLQFTKQRVELLKQELSIAQKKNAEEKSSLEALMAGDIEGFLEKQAAAGAGAALAAGSKALTSLFSASALGAGFKTLEGQGLSDKQMRKAEDLTLQRFGIQSTGVLSGTTTQEEALKSQGRELAGVLSEVAQQEASFAQADVSINNATITAAQLSFDRKLTEVANANVGVQNKYKGGLIYASRGMFVPRGTDTVPAMLTPGEFVVNRAAVQRGNNLQILTAMNNGGDGVSSPGASSPGAMRGGGRVGYYSAGGEVAGISEAFNTALPQLTAIFTDFATTVEKLVNTKFQVALDPTNINVNFNGTSFLSSLKEELGKELLDKVAQEIKTYKSSTSGDLVKKSVL